MPCYEGPRPQDVERDRLTAGAFPALLCGLFRRDERAVLWAHRWCLAHAKVDEEQAKGHSYSSALMDLQARCDEILIAFNLERGAVQPCQHLDARSDGWCRQCGFHVDRYLKVLE